MKVTKNILREIIEAEMNLLNEDEGDVERTGWLGWRNPQRTLNALLNWLDKDDRLGDLPTDASDRDRDRKRKFKTKFEMIWSQIDGAIIQSDIDENQTLKGIFDRAVVKEWIGTTAATSMASGKTASGIQAPIDPVTVDIPTDDDEDDTATEETSSQTGGETDLSPESITMLTAMKDNGSVLKRRMKGDKVGLLQDALRARLGNMSHQWLGAAGESDKDYGGKTELAVKAVQTKYGLSDDGAAGPNTAASLLANAEATGSAVSRGSGSSPEEAASAEIALVWDPAKSVWWYQGEHKADGTDYTLWIRKGNRDYHANATYSEVTTADIVGLNESKSIIERFNSYLNEIEFTAGTPVNNEPAEVGEDGEAVAGPVVTVTGGPEAGAGEPSEDSISTATEALEELATALRRQLVSIADENEEQMNKSWYRDTDEALILENLRTFDNLAEEYYESCLSHVAIFTDSTPIPSTILTPTEYHYKHLKDAGAKLDAAETAQEKRNAVVSWYDTELHGAQYQEMKRIIERNARALTANSSEVMASGATEQQATITSTNTHIRELVLVIKETAKTIGENSYGYSATEWGGGGGENADEEAVMTALGNFNVAAQEFYERAAQTISDNELNVPTPSEMLLAYYKRSVTSDDKAETVQEMSDEIKEFLDLGGHVRILNRNNRSYSSYVSGDLTSTDGAITESLSYDRFQKLAGILKG